MKITVANRRWNAVKYGCYTRLQNSTAAPGPNLLYSLEFFMSLELLNQLENKVQTTLESLELLRLEMEELKQENEALKEEKQAWETRLGQLLLKFSELDSAAATESND
jgi:cell division protein ZapB